MNSTDPAARPPATRTGGLARWSVYHPIGVVMLSLAILVVGTLSYTGLAVNMLPRVVKPEIRVRILNPGVPAKIMEDDVTRQLEEQLAITEDAISVESNTREGRSAVDLIFQYGKDIDLALRDASTRLDRAKRFLPDGIDQPVIYKRDPMQLPVMEFMVSSTSLNTIQLTSWIENTLSKWLLNLPGVTAVEIGGGKTREIQILPDQQALAARRLTINDLYDAVRKSNVERSTGRLYIGSREISSRTASRVGSLADLANLPIKLADGSIILLKEVARIRDHYQDEKLRVRLNGTTGVKVSIQKRPTANTVAVADAVKQRLQKLKTASAQNGKPVIPENIHIATAEDQSLYIRAALTNAQTAAVFGALLAMLVVYLFLGDLRRTLIIGSAIPIAVVVTFLLMNAAGLTLNIMTLGGLAIGIGMLVDNTIVMLENIHRKQLQRQDPKAAAVAGAAEVNSAIVASTSTNLAAIVPFLFVGGFLGLLFRELIFTISSAIVASMLVALTLVPALGAALKPGGGKPPRPAAGRLMTDAQAGITRLVGWLMNHGPAKLFLVLALTLSMVFSLFSLGSTRKQNVLPVLDTGVVSVRIKTDPGTTLAETDKVVRSIEQTIQTLPDVKNIFTISGGYVFGRSTFESHNSAYLMVQLAPRSQRSLSVQQWIGRFHRAMAKKRLVGVKYYAYKRNIRGLRLGRGNDDVSLRIQGQDLEMLRKIADRYVRRLSAIKGLRNVQHSLEDVRQELAINIDRQKAATLGLNIEDISKAVHRAISGEVITNFIDGDRSYDVRLRLARRDVYNLEKINSLIIGHDRNSKAPVYLGQVAKISFPTAPATIMRDNQQRIVEITASFTGKVPVGTLVEQIERVKNSITLPPGYVPYNAGIVSALKENRHKTIVLALLAVFLVFVVLAVQYESLRNPLIILLTVPFSLIGVVLGLVLTNTPVSMMVWLGVIMLIGIVVNNAIVLIEYIELVRRKGHAVRQAVIEAVRLRLRPILMTTLTTVTGLLPLALAIGDGAEMLQPLAISIIFGLGFSLIISLLLIPIAYSLFHRQPSQAA